MILKENPQAEIILYPIISENMKCSVLELIRGIESLIESGVDIINLSVGDEYNYHPELESICKDAQRQGILIVAAHSNRNVYATYPADLSFVVGVKCTDKNSPEKLCCSMKVAMKLSSLQAIFLCIIGNSQIDTGK